METAAPMSFLLVAAGGALGSMARHAVSLGAGALMGAAYPWGTLAVNVLGSAAIGALAARGLDGPARLFWITGILGGFTTFSAFSLEAALLWERAPAWAALYVAASLMLSLAAFAAAWSLAQA
jgi:CrcB protein